MILYDRYTSCNTYRPAGLTSAECNTSGMEQYMERIPRTLRSSCGCNSSNFPSTLPLPLLSPIMAIEHRQQATTAASASSSAPIPVQALHRQGNRPFLQYGLFGPNGKERWLYSKLRLQVSPRRTFALFQVSTLSAQVPSYVASARRMANSTETGVHDLSELMRLGLRSLPGF
ncbi:hypothetical protein OG21DRAFT_1607756 [Imleria badia]|nr:hypothetical protein OG21DRAFT_1607756 [Imleria badia]